MRHLFWYGVFPSLTIAGVPARLIVKVRVLVIRRLVCPCKLLCLMRPWASLHVETSCVARSSLGSVWSRRRDVPGYELDLTSSKTFSWGFLFVCMLILAAVASFGTGCAFFGLRGRRSSLGGKA